MIKIEIDLQVFEGLQEIECSINAHKYEGDKSKEVLPYDDKVFYLTLLKDRLLTEIALYKRLSEYEEE